MTPVRYVCDHSLDSTRQVAKEDEVGGEEDVEAEEQEKE